MSNEEAREVDEMAPLADDSPAAGNSILRPVVTGNRTGVHGNVHRGWTAPPRNAFLHLDGEWCEPPIESDHDHSTRRPLDRVEICLGEGKRLLDEQVLAGFQCAKRQRPMAVVARQDEHSVDRRIVEDVVDARRDALEIERLIAALGTTAPGDRAQPRTGSLPVKHTRGKIAGANDARGQLTRFARSDGGASFDSTVVVEVARAPVRIAQHGTRCWRAERSRRDRMRATLRKHRSDA